MSSSGSAEEEETIIVFQVEEQSSGDDPPMSEWSSLVFEAPEGNKKRVLYAQGLYSPGSEELCTKYVSQSDSDVFRHLYYNYPAVNDPGITKAILGPEKPIIHEDDGQTLYLALCLEMNTSPVRLFHRNLLNEDINLSFYGVASQGMRAMAMALQYNKFVKRFNLTDNFLNDDACYHLGQMLNANVTLQELNLSGCRIGRSGLIRLGDTLQINKTLRILNLSRNDIGDEGGVYLANMIYRGMSVKHVNVSKNGLGRTSALAIAEAFEYKDKICNLDLSWNNFFHSPSTAKMIEQMSQSSLLSVINLSWNALEGERIAEAIKNILTLPTLTVLDLSNNRLAGEAIVIITPNLIKAKKLITFDLSFNPMTPVDALVVIERMLKPRVKVENLGMTGICVSKNFLVVLERVQKMKARKNFKVTYGTVLENWTIVGQDAREVILRRADFLGNLSKKNKVDIALYFMALVKENPKPMVVKDLVDRCSTDLIPIDGDLIAELATVFPGPKSAKAKFINVENMVEYIHRMWPDKKLPPTPLPEPEPEPVLVPDAPKGKGKKGKK